jgi:hypothetical protein
MPHPLDSFPKALHKPVQILQSIRAAAKRHLYADDPDEYYRGLLVYLLGALKFANLDQLPWGPLPKQAAFWAASAVQKLREEKSECKFATHVTRQTPHAVLIDFRPEVQIRRRNTDDLLNVTYGMHLYRDDIISTYEEAQAIVHCNRGPCFIVPPERNQRIDCVSIPQERVLAHLNLEHTARLLDVARIFTKILHEAPTQSQPLLLAPRNTRIQVRRPTFHWRSTMGTRGYRLTVRMPNERTWSRETDQTTLSYPDEEPALTPGSGNSVLLQNIGTSLPTDHTYLRVLTSPEQMKIQATEEAIRTLNLGSEPQIYLLARTHAKFQLWHTAIQELKRLSQTTEALAPGILIELGTLHLHIGLVHLAIGYYEAAHDEADDEHTKAIASVGLAAGHYTSGQVSQTCEILHSLALDAASETITLLANHWLSEIESISRAGNRMEQPISMLDYVRTLAEQLAPQLASTIRQIPEFFFEQLEELKKMQLKPKIAWTPAHLGEESLAAFEISAATFLMTQSLLSTLTEEELQRPDSALEAWIRERAGHIAQQKVGLSEQQAEHFARRYTTESLRNLSTLRTLLRDQT